MCPHQRSQLAFVLRCQLDRRSFVSRQDISPLRSRGGFAMLMDSRPWSIAAKSHYCGNCGKCDSVCQAGSTESPIPARCTSRLTNPVGALAPTRPSASTMPASGDSRPHCWKPLYSRAGRHLPRRCEPSKRCARRTARRTPACRFAGPTRLKAAKRNRIRCCDDDDDDDDDGGGGGGGGGGTPRTASRKRDGHPRSGTNPTGATPARCRCCRPERQTIAVKWYAFGRSNEHGYNNDHKTVHHSDFGVRYVALYVTLPVNHFERLKQRWSKPLLGKARIILLR